MGDIKAWKMDFGSDALTSSSDKKSLDPPGFDAATSRELVASSTSSSSKRKDSTMLQRKQAALWARATGPIKQIGFMMFMGWMMGNSIQIFSIIMTFTMLSAPFAAILSSGEMFPREEGWPQLDTLLPRLLFCLIQCGQVLFAMYKLNAMGLLPAHASDWISVMPVPVAREASLAALG